MKNDKFLPITNCADLRRRLEEAQVKIERLRAIVDKLEWAENHPELAMQQIKTNWRTCGAGFRETWFGFGAAFNMAREAAEAARKGTDAEGIQKT